MLAIDTSSFIAYLSGDDGWDVEVVDEALKSEFAVFPPAVLSELLSDPKLDHQTIATLLDLPILEISKGYWERVGLLRAKLLGKKLKARLADALIAQSCLDHDTQLVTRDQDFRAFARLSKLRVFRP